MWNNWHSYMLLAEMQSDAIALEHSLAVYEKIEYSLTIRPRNPTPGSFYPTEIKMRVTAKTHT